MPMKLIDKDAVVAEIERRIEHNTEWKDACKTLAVLAANQAIEEDKKILSIIDTLEVKEVDLEHLEQEVEDFCERFDDRKESWYKMTPHDQKLMVSPTFANFAMQLAKHFFELGMAVSNKAQKGENI